MPFGQRHLAGSIDLDHLAGELGRLEKEEAPWKFNKDDSHIFTIVAFSSNTLPSYPFPTRSHKYGTTFKIFVKLQADVPIFRDVLLFQRQSNGHYVTVPPYNEFEIGNQAEEWILVFRRNCNSRIRNSKLPLTFALPEDLLTVNLVAEMVTKLPPPGSEGVQLSKSALNLLLQDEVDFQENGVAPFVRNAVGQMWQKETAELPSTARFNKSHIGTLKKKLITAVATTGLSSAVRMTGNLEDDLVSGPKARLEKAVQEITGCMNDIGAAQQELEKWKGQAANCGHALGRNRFVYLTNVSEVDTDEHLRRLLNACDVHVKCETITFGRTIEDYEKGLQELLDRANQDLADTTQRLDDRQKTVAEHITIRATEDEKHRREMEAKILAEIGTTARALLETSPRGEELVMEFLQGLTAKLSAPTNSQQLPGPLKPAKTPSKQITDAATPDSPKDHDPSAG